MTAYEYFGDWMKVIDKLELSKIMKWIQLLDESTLCPSKKDIFKAFKLCSLNNCRVIFLGLDPYPQKGVATGILFGNSKETSEEQLSPSLKVVKEAAINYEKPHKSIIFDNSLEEWAKQGILMINSSLTCVENMTGIHSNIWRPFISKLIENISWYNNGYVFVLFGQQAHSFRSYIKGYQKIIESLHPAYYARINENMPTSIFKDINSYLKYFYNEHIDFYKEL